MYRPLIASVLILQRRVQFPGLSYPNQCYLRLKRMSLYNSIERSRENNVNGKLFSCYVIKVI